MNIFILQACNKEFSGRICGKKIIENKCQRCGSEVEFQIKMMSRVCLERPIIFHIKCNNFLQVHLCDYTGTSIVATFFNDVLEKILFTKVEEFNQADEKVKKSLLKKV